MTIVFDDVRFQKIWKNPNIMLWIKIQFSPTLDIVLGCSNRVNQCLRIVFDHLRFWKVWKNTNFMLWNLQTTWLQHLNDGKFQNNTQLTLIFESGCSNKIYQCMTIVFDEIRFRKVWKNPNIMLWLCNT